MGHNGGHFAVAETGSGFHRQAVSVSREDILCCSAVDFHSARVESCPQVGVAIVTAHHGLHTLFLDRVYVDGANGSSPHFRWVPVSADSSPY